MRKAQVYVHGVKAGTLKDLENGNYIFVYFSEYRGAPVSLTMPVAGQSYEFDKFPPFFEGLLPEGVMLDALLRKCKLDKNDLLSYFAMEQLGLNQTVVAEIMQEFAEVIPRWKELIHVSFLSKFMQKKYLEVLRERSGRLGF